MNDDQLKANVPRPLPDEFAQCATIYLEARDLSQYAVRNGYDPHAVADGLLEAARDILADNKEFMTVFERFWAGWNLHKSPKDRQSF